MSLRLAPSRHPILHSDHTLSLSHPFPQVSPLSTILTEHTQAHTKSHFKFEDSVPHIDVSIDNTLIIDDSRMFISNIPQRVV